MGLTKSIPTFSVEQYLAMERSAEERHEFLDGVIYDMAGESPEHGDISSNVTGLVLSQLKGSCRARIKDTKVRSGPAATSPFASRALCSYPDLVVICGEPEYADEKREVVTNPTMIVEVLSPSTEAFDRGVKFARYQTNPTLKDYVLVSQNAPVVEVFSRHGDSWLYRRFAGFEETAIVPSLDIRLPLRDVFNRVAFPVEEIPSPPERP